MVTYLKSTVAEYCALTLHNSTGGKIPPSLAGWSSHQITRDNKKYSAVHRDPQYWVRCRVTGGRLLEFNVLQCFVILGVKVR